MFYDFSAIDIYKSIHNNNIHINRKIDKFLVLNQKIILKFYIYIYIYINLDSKVKGRL